MHICVLYKIFQQHLGKITVETLRKQQTNPRPSAVNCSKLDQKAGALPATVVIPARLFKLSQQGGEAWRTLRKYF